MAILETDRLVLRRLADDDLDIYNFGFGTGSAALAIWVADAVRLVKGEVPWDLDSGNDYDSIEGKNYTEEKARALLRAAILSVPVVVEVVSIKLSLDHATRVLSGTCEATYQFDEAPATGQFTFDL